MVDFWCFGRGGLGFVVVVRGLLSHFSNFPGRRPPTFHPHRVGRAADTVCLQVGNA